MKHLNKYRVFEANYAKAGTEWRKQQQDNSLPENYHYKVIIEWEHGDADKSTVEKYPFETEKEMRHFLEFTEEFRGYTSNNNNGHFGRNSHKMEDARKLADKWSMYYADMLPNDVTSDRWCPSIEHIWVEVDGLPLNIVWRKHLDGNKIDLPKIGDKIITNTGRVSGYGPGLWKKPSSFFYNYNDISHYGDTDVDADNNPGDDYIEIEVEVSDCKINTSKTYHKTNCTYDRHTDKETLVNEYDIYYDHTDFDYVLLCKFMDKFITVNRHGFDPKYSNKFHYPLYGDNDIYEM